MKITKIQLKKIIKEELEVALQQEGIFDKVKGMLGLGTGSDDWWLNKTPSHTGRTSAGKQEYKNFVSDVRDFVEAGFLPDGRPDTPPGARDQNWRVDTALKMLSSLKGGGTKAIPEDFWSAEASAIIKDPIEALQNYITDSTGGARVFAPFHRGFRSAFQDVGGLGFEGDKVSHPERVRLKKALQIYKEYPSELESAHSALEAIINRTAPREVLFAIKAALSPSLKRSQVRMGKLLESVKTVHAGMSLILDDENRRAIETFLSTGPRPY